MRVPFSGAACTTLTIVTCRLRGQSRPFASGIAGSLARNSAALPPSRAPERTHAQVEKHSHHPGGEQKRPVIGAVGPACPDPPKRRSKDHHGQKEQGTRHLQPQNAAHPAKRTQKTAHAASDARSCPSRLPAACRSAATRLSCGCSGSSLRSGAHALADHPSGNSQPNAQHASNGLRFHFDTMVAAPVAGAPGGPFSAARSCSRTPMEVR